ncbi:MAG: chromosomal replication initiator protein DnaA [Phycisphaerae bacterium]|nr:chromosomal replication initiator protein DnaA [Phycisphaerae bacterium]
MQSPTDHPCDVWKQMEHYLATRHAGVTRAWFADLRASGLDRGEMVIQAAEAGQLRYLWEHCIPPFIEAAQTVTGRLVTVRFVGPDGESDARIRGTASHPTEPLGLNAAHTFENFVTGPCNRLAHAAAIAVSDTPGRTYNPLFIHGSAGLGKTHLLHAVCHRVLDRAPMLRTLYLTCEMFTNHFIAAVEHGTLPDFRNHYRRTDLLVIDDIQFLSMAERGQEEFFHTFNTLYQDQKQIILSADCQPSEIPTLEARLTSRFNWGLVAGIDPPCIETRIAITRKKAKLLNLDLSDEVVKLIAGQFRTNLRELEGALVRLHGLAKLEGAVIDIDTARRVLGELVPSAPTRVRVDEIIAAVTRRFGVKTSDLQGRRRSRSIALPRQICMHLARRMTAHSLEEIGGFFGGRDHTTVLHADRLIAERSTTDGELRRTLELLESELRRA